MQVIVVLIHSYVVKELRFLSLELGKQCDVLILEGVAQRWLALTPRCSYSVPGPLSLWHIDGNHKLVRLDWVRRFI